MPKECFVLGAGFSRAINNSMPTLSGLSEMIWDNLDNLINGPVERVDKKGFDRDIELLMSYLYGNPPWLKQEERLQNQRDFERLSKRISTLIEDKRRDAFGPSPNLPNWVKKLFNYWLEEDSEVITLNYDTAIERILREDPEEWFGELKPEVAEELYSIPLRSAGRIEGGSFDGQSNFQLHKLHGSTNWFYSGLDSFPGEPIYSLDFDSLTQSQREHELAESVADKIPLIIPPVTNKDSLYENQSLRLQWRKAYSAINNAQSIYFIGYSFPKTDLTMRYFFSQVTEPRERWTYIVNEPGEFESYREMLDPDYYRLIDKYTAEIDNTLDGEGPIPHFVEDLVQNDLDR